MSRSILITGASVAGNTAAWWLAGHGHTVTVVERAPAFRTGGQNVDVRGAGREVLRRMGLEEGAMALATHEDGFDMVGEDNEVLAHFGIDEDSDRGLTAELEIRRGDVARVIHDAASDRAAFRYGDAIRAIDQDGEGARVTFESGNVERYDLVIVAEGVGSSTRELVFPGENEPRWMDMTIGFFSAPRQPQDGSSGKQYNTVGGRGATLKPSRDGRIGVYLGIQKKPEGEHEWDAERQKRFLHDQFADDGWEFPRLLAEMDRTDDFYFDVLRQVKMARWSDRRVVLTGDAAWCPTPMSGIGTTLAIVGAYVLAGELGRSDDIAAALAAYERVMRPFVEEGQGVPKIVPRLMWPHTRLGVAALRGAARIAGTAPVQKLVIETFARDSYDIELPDYGMAHA